MPSHNEKTTFHFFDAVAYELGQLPRFPWNFVVKLFALFNPKREKQGNPRNVKNLIFLDLLLLLSVIIVISEFVELNKVQRPYLWPYDYSFMRTSRYVVASRLPNYNYN